MMSRSSRIPAYVWRRFGQSLFFALFLFLFIKTDYSGSDELTYAVNILFRIDPLLAFCAWLAGKTVIALMLPALITLALTFVFGRFFCGWICPMGTLIDGSRFFFPHGKENFTRDWRQLKYYLLFFLLAASFCSLPLAGYVDPFSILVRGFTFALYPALDHGVTAFFTFTYQHGPDWLNAVTEPVYALLKDHILPFRSMVYSLSLFSLLLLLIVIGLSYLERRFFCRNVCPLGGLLALVSRFSVLRLHGGSAECNKCRQCRKVCRMGAIDEERNIATADCTLCLDCLALCPTNRIHFTWGGERTGVQATGISRRAFVATLTSGFVVSLFLPSRPFARRPEPLLVRPPGALAEKDFLGRCVRCGECMKVCIGNALHSTWLDAGFEGVFTPRLHSRIGYCEYNCTLCGQVCPTGAIRKLTMKEKHATVIGRAYFDKNLCLPYARGIPCIVCEEHCPTPDKAIRFREVASINNRGESVILKQPYVVDELCIGCGICENKCPLPGRAAVIVTSEGESRHAGYSLVDGY
ncbi:MAG: 4Fe-4S binding protein [Pseudomonadota bacterium]